MLRTKNAPQKNNSIIEIKALVETHVGAGRSINITDQNPLAIGRDRYYRVTLIDELEGTSTLLYAAIKDDDTVEFWDITFPLNPFQPMVNMEPHRM